MLYLHPDSPPREKRSLSYLSLADHLHANGGFRISQRRDLKSSVMVVENEREEPLLREMVNVT